MKKHPSEGLCISVPVKFRRRGGRKLILSPDGVPQNFAVTAKFDDVMMHALARAWKWQNIYENGEYGSLEAFAERHRLNKSYTARVMRLNFLAPDIREAIMNGTHPKGLKLADLMHPFPSEWDLQRQKFGFPQTQ